DRGHGDREHRAGDLGRIVLRGRAHGNRVDARAGGHAGRRVQGKRKYFLGGWEQRDVGRTERIPLGGNILDREMIAVDDRYRIAGRNGENRVLTGTDLDRAGTYGQTHPFIPTPWVRQYSSAARARALRHTNARSTVESWVRGEACPSGGMTSGYSIRAIIPLE